MYVNLVRDKESGKSKGFAFLKYEDQRSTDLAVDNLGGASIMGRVLKVDHTRYKRKDEEEEMERERAMNEHASRKDGVRNGRRSSREGSVELKGPLLVEERELAALIQDHDEDDPMKGYLVREKKEEVANALARLAKKAQKSGDRKKHHHHHGHRSRRRSYDSTQDEDGKETHRSRRYSNDSESGPERRREERRHQRRRSRSP